MKKTDKKEPFNTMGKTNKKEPDERENRWK